jgi:hypothetical protein
MESTGIKTKAKTIITPKVGQKTGYCETTGV